MASEEEEATATMPEEATAVPQVQQQNRYAHLVSGNKTHTVIHQQQQVSYRSTPGEKSKQLAYCVDSSNQTATMSKPPPLGQSGTSVQQQQQQQQRKAGYQSSQYYYSSFSSVDWREQWIIMKDKILERADEPQNQRRLILFIVCCALLLDNMLYMVIVPIIPDYLRSIGSWTTHTENAKWIRLNGTGHNHRPQWQRVGGQVVYEGEDSAVGFLFASKAIVQLFINPFSGAIIDRIGYEIPMMIGLTVMFFSTMVFACGQTYSVLFLARSLQGVGSAFADTSGLAMIADRFTEENERQRALGVALAFISFGCLVAPPFGSVLYQGAGKEVPFIILSLVCLLDGSLLLLVTPPGTFSSLLPSYYNKQQQQVQSQQQQQQSLDSESGKTSTTTTKAPMLQRQKSISRRQSMKVASAGEAPKGTPIYVLFRDPCIACCSGALVVANVSLAFLEPTISIWVQNTMPDIEEWQMGMIWLPAFVPHVLGVYSTVKLADKYPRYQWLIAAIGLVLEGVSCLMVPFCSSFWSLIIPISLICFGLALIDTAILPTLGYLVDTRYVSVYGSIYAIADISYSLSYAIGPIIAGGIVEAIGFAALNILIAVVTLGYTPSLMMLRNIHDYEPFEEGDGNNVNNRQQQQQLQRKEAKERAPFGQFGRTPISEEEEEEEEEVSGIENSDDGDDDESSAADHHPTNRQQTTAASGKYGSPKWAAAPALKGSRSEQTASKSLSVTIREEPTEANGQQQQQKARNPFLSGAQDD